MNVLVSMRLGDGSVGAHLRPLTQIEGVERVLCVRNLPGPSLPGVEYHCPPPVLAKIDAVAAIYRLCLLTWLSLTRRPAYMHSYLLFPHGVITFIAARLTGRRVGTSLLAGPIEFYVLGKRLKVHPEGRLPPSGRLLLFVLRHCDVVTATGSLTRDFLIARGVREDRIFILHHAVSARDFHPMDIPRSYDIVSVGRLAAVKRVDIILKAAALVRKDRPDLKVAVVGDGPCRGELEKLAGDLGLGGSVEFLGARDDVVRWYNSGKVFVLASEREGFPFALLEAMMCGTPCVTSDCGDIMDVVRDGQNALVIQRHDDADGFARAITALLADSDLGARLGRGGLDTAQELSPERVSADWRSIVDRVCRR